MNGVKAIEIMLAFIWAVVVDNLTMLTHWRGNEHVYGRSIDSYYQWVVSIRVAELTFAIRKLVDGLVLASGLDVSELTSDGDVDDVLAG